MSGMDAIEPNWVALLVFIGAWGVACISGFFVSGSLPLSEAPADIRSGGGPLMLLLNVGLLAVLTVATLLFGIAELRWTSLVIAIGMIFLFAPFAVQDLPPLLKDTRLGMAAILLLVVAAFVGLYLFGALHTVGHMVASA